MLGAGVTKGDLEKLAKYIQGSNFSVVADFNSKNKPQTENAIREIQRQIEVTTLIAGGMSVAAATAQAGRDVALVPIPPPIQRTPSGSRHMM